MCRIPGLSAKSIVVGWLIVCAGCSCPRCAYHQYRIHSGYNDRPTAAHGIRAIGEAQGDIAFQELTPSVRETVRSDNSQNLYEQLIVNLPEGFSVDERFKASIEARRVTLTVRKPTGSVVFLCRIIVDIHPTAKRLTIRVSSGGNVDASVERFDRVANELKAGLLKRLKPPAE